MKYIIKLYLLSLILIATPMIAMDGVAVIDMRTAVLSLSLIHISEPTRPY